MHQHRIALGAALLLAVGCSKSEGGGASATASALPAEAPTVAIVGTPRPPEPASALALALASASASPAASASVASSAASPPASAAAVPRPSASVASASPPGSPVASSAASPSASAKIATATTSSAPKPETPPLKAASTHTAGKNFTLDVSSPGCRVDSPCTLTLRLVAVGAFHVNKEYPYRFTAVAAPGVQFLGSGEANVFSRASGDFHEDAEKEATMTVRFKPTVAGEAIVAGTYKMSVCSATQCQIEAQAVKLAVPTM